MVVFEERLSPPAVGLSGGFTNTNDDPRVGGPVVLPGGIRNSFLFRAREAARQVMGPPKGGTPTCRLRALLGCRAYAAIARGDMGAKRRTTGAVANRGPPLAGAFGLVAAAVGAGERKFAGA